MVMMSCQLRCFLWHAWARAATYGQQSDGVDGELVNLAVSHDCGGCEVFKVEWVKDEEEEEEEGRKKEEKSG